MKSSSWVWLATGLGIATVAFAVIQGTKLVGQQSDGTTLVPSGQSVRAVGQRVTLSTRPVDSAISSNGTLAFVKDNKGFVVLDTATRAIKQSVTVSGGTSLTGIEVALDQHVWVSDAGSSIHRYKPNGANYKFVEKLNLPSPAVGGSAYPCGFQFSSSGNRLYATSSRGNELVVFNMVNKAVEYRVPVDPCPYDVAVTSDGKYAWVACWGGQAPVAGDRLQKSSGTSIKVDVRGVPVSASVMCIDLTSRQVIKRIPVELQPSQVLLTSDNQTLYVALANADQVLAINTLSRSIEHKIVTKPDPKLLFGSMPNALCLSADEDTLFVANGGNNAVAVIDVSSSAPVIKGHIPAGWYPTAIEIVGSKLVVSSAKGTGSRQVQPNGSYGVYGFTGTVDFINLPDKKQLTQYTAMVKADALVPQSLAASNRNVRPGIKPVPIPAVLGEPSTIEHVVYIIKENRTYDQIFGDFPQGNGQASLCVFPRQVTPNHHKIAEEFVLLDNYYCAGVLSADGHAWATEGLATNYYERTFGGWTRSYPFGDDPLAVASTGFLWDHVLAAGKSFRNYGEFDYATPQPNVGWLANYNDWASGNPTITYRQNIGVERVRSYSMLGYPGWNMSIPEQVRADAFIRDVGTLNPLPNLIIIYLPQDHTSGTSANNPTPRACMADNDLAVGRVIEKLSQLPQWKKMAVFVNEDDPQDGFDHVDGHRSICLVASPYAKRGVVVSQFYNQSSVLHTICRMLGIKPMNQMVAAAPLMTECFTTTPNYAPYTKVPNQIPLNEMNPGSREPQTDLQREMARLTATIDFEKPDAADEDTLNRIVWHATMGDKRYPREFAGAHGKGLKALGLKLDARGVEVDDD